MNRKLGICDLAQDTFKGKKVVIRVDFNVPMQNGVVSDKTRITSTLPTIKCVLKREPKCIVLLSHCGRPDGKRNPKYSLRPVATVLEELLTTKIIFVDDLIEDVPKQIQNSPNGSILLLENLRFYPEEEGSYVDSAGKKVKCSDESIEKFKKALTSLGDIFVNDAFGTAHRAHSSMVGIDLPIKAAGLLMTKELEYFEKALGSPQRPFLAILGGAKVHDKIQLIMNLLNKVDTMIIGGAMAFTFKKILNGMSIGNSIFDENGAKHVEEIMSQAKAKNVKIYLPCDFVCADKFDEKANVQIIDDTVGIPDNWMGVDCGEKSIKHMREIIMQSKLILWNGPVGVFEMEKFAKGSLACLEAVIDATKNGTISIVGGGDTASLVEKYHKSSLISHLSTGGGASLELLEGKILPGVAFLSDKST